VGQDNQKSTPQIIPPPAKAQNFSWPDIRTQSQFQQAADVQQSGGKIYPEQGKRIGEILKAMRVIDDKILHAVEMRHQTKKAKDKPTGELLVYMGIIEPEVLTRALCIQSGVLMVDVQSIHIPFEILKYVSNEIAREKRAIPVHVYHGTLYLAVADPLNFSEQHFFAFSTGLKIKPVFAPDSQIDESINSKWVALDSEKWAG